MKIGTPLVVTGVFKMKSMMLSSNLCVFSLQIAIGLLEYNQAHTQPLVSNYLINHHSKNKITETTPARISNRIYNPSKVLLLHL